MDRGKDQDEIGKLDVLAVGADGLVSFLERFASCHHVDDASADFNHQLLRHHNV